MEASFGRMPSEAFPFRERSMPAINRIRKSYELLFVPKPTPPYDPQWEEDQAWYKEAVAKDGVDYDELKKYAETKFAELNEAFDVIDKKAEWFFGIAFGSAGAAILAFQSWKLSPLVCAPSLASLFVAMWLAMRARIPISKPTTMSIRDAVSVAEKDSAWKLRMIASTHCAASGMLRVTDWKSGQLQRALGALVLAALLFLLPVTVSHYFSGSPPSPDRSSESSRSVSAEHTVGPEAAKEAYPAKDISLRAVPSGSLGSGPARHNPVRGSALDSSVPQPREQSKP
jgi:hypothetical protein